MSSRCRCHKSQICKQDLCDKSICSQKLRKNSAIAKYICKTLVYSISSEKNIHFSILLNNLMSGFHFTCIYYCKCLKNLCWSVTRSKLPGHRLYANVLQMLHYLQQIVGGVVHQHNEGSSSDVVHTPGETNQQDGGNMVHYLFFKVLKEREQEKILSYLQNNTMVLDLCHNLCHGLLEVPC